MIKAAAAFLVGLLLSTSASAYLKAGPNVAGQGAHHRLQGSAVTDTMATSLSAAYSFRKVRSAYAGSAVKLRRTTGGTQDIGFTAQGDFDTAAAATFCAATTCFIDTWYDQSANARNATQATPANQPAYIADCGNGKPCARVLTAGQILQTAAATFVAKSTMNTVARRDSGAGICYLLLKGVNSYFPDTANNWRLTDFSVGFQLVPAADGAWHSATAVVDGAASVAGIDGTETVANIPGGGGSVSITLARLDAATAVCSQSEALLWDNYALSQDERIALTNNQKQYYTPLPLDNFAAPAGAYGMRRLKSSYSGPAIRLRRASDNAEQDIGFLGFTGFTGAPIDTVAANSFCAATSCFVVTWYDQSATARHAGQGTPASQPQFIFNCNGTLPCFRFSTQNLISGPQVTPAAATSYSVVAKTDTAASCAFIQAGVQQLTSTAGSAQWLFWNGNPLFATAAHGAWHAGNGTINGASSALNIDGTDTLGSLATVTTADWLWTPAAGAAGPTCSMGEAVFWNGYALTANERAVLAANQRSFWGF